MSRIVVVGCGHWGFNLVRNFYQLGRLAGVVEARPEMRARVAELAPGLPTWESLSAEALAACDGVVIATPAPTHFQLGQQCLLAGKDVYIEKPLALRLADGEELTRLAQQHGRILMVGHLLEYHDCFVKLLHMVRSGELGQVRYLYSNRLSLGIIRYEEDVIWSLASHDVEAILRLAGSVPLTVSAQTICQLQPGVADFATIQMTFEGNVGAHIFVSWLHPEKEQRLVVVGTERTVCFDGVRGQLTVYRSGVAPGESTILRGAVGTIAASGLEPLQTECQAFLTAIATRQAPLTDGVCGCQVLSVLEAAQRSTVDAGAPHRVKAWV